MKKKIMTEAEAFNIRQAAKRNQEAKRVSDRADKLVLCPDCGEPVDVDYTPEYHAQRPYERVCYACGWFDENRYASIDEAKVENAPHEARKTTGD